ncbi:sensor histidine kinase [Alteraurantiacibacter palmitatis]|uniref:histidine kinase n=1 Tax=Alteraurantiacibacter palmitatis TaxID=2054628 RepID=A0ABV7EBA1_9SPHN
MPAPNIQNLFRGLPLFGGRPVIAVPAALSITLLAFLLRLFMDDLLPTGFPYVTFFPAVLISALLFGLWGGVASTALGFVLARWFFIAPVGSMSLDGPPGWAMALYLFVTVVNVVTIHLLQIAFRGLDAERRRNRDLARSRELLFHELQHRVGNNLQMIGSLLAMQARRVQDDAARVAVEEAVRRVSVVGKIQRTLYNPEGSQRSLSGLLGPLVRDIVASAQGSAVTIRLEATRDRLLPAEQAIPVALIVSEAVSNALEHGYGPGGGGELVVRITQDSPAQSDGSLSHLCIAVEDDGAGLPDGFSMAASGSLGLKIARSLAGSLGGEFTMMPGKRGGTCSQLRFPLPDGDAPRSVSAPENGAAVPLRAATA